MATRPASRPIALRSAGLPPSASACAIAVMAKASIPGRTKTRLSPPLTHEEAAALNTAFLRDIGANLALAGRHAPIAPFMAFGPPGTVSFFEATLPADIGLIETWYPDFGDCLFEAADAMLGQGYGAACLLNSDSPTLPTAWLIELAEALARPGDRMVLGPSEDGGYYVIGVKAPHKRLFENIAWSTETVARDTLARAREIGLEVVLLPTWYDIDDRQSLRRLMEETEGCAPEITGAKRHAAPHSAAALRALMAKGDFAARTGLSMAFGG